jgi:putative transposase
MPWKVTSVHGERRRFVHAVVRRVASVAQLCRQFEISQKTGFKWLRRFWAAGSPGLEDRSRRPRHSPRRLAPSWVQLIDRWRRRRPHWGAKKIYERLRRERPGDREPCVKTVYRWLRRRGRVPRRPPWARRGPTLAPPGLTIPTRPNQVWTVDFKGWFRTADGVRQEPLTVRDLFSRYGLEVRLLPSQADRCVRQTLQWLFWRRGLPTAIRVDQGSPFGGKGALGLSRLSVWWLRLGIRVEFTRRARPGDNAAHEQFHGCYQREIVAVSAPDRRTMQRRSRQWLAGYNQERPHEALGGRTPAQLYRPSSRRYPKPLPPLRYPQGWELRRVRNRGHIKWQGRLRFVGRAFVGQTVGLRLVESNLWEVYLSRQLIGQLHAHDPGGLRPARWLRLTPLQA